MMKAFDEDLSTLTDDTLQALIEASYDQMVDGDEEASDWHIRLCQEALERSERRRDGGMIEIGTDNGSDDQTVFLLHGVTKHEVDIVDRNLVPIADEMIEWIDACSFKIDKLFDPSNVLVRRKVSRER